MAYELHPLFNGRVVSTNVTNFFATESFIDKKQEEKTYNFPPSSIRETTNNQSKQQEYVTSVLIAK
jgi:hypothetical protein